MKKNKNKKCTIINVCGAKLIDKENLRFDQFTEKPYVLTIEEAEQIIDKLNRKYCTNDNGTNFIKTNDYRIIDVEEKLEE
jgi:hypothetical protein